MFIREKIVFVVKSINTCDDLTLTTKQTEALFDSEEKAKKGCDENGKQYRQFPYFLEFEITIMEVL